MKRVSVLALDMSTKIQSNHLLISRNFSFLRDPNVRHVLITIFVEIQSKIPVSCPRFWENATIIPSDGTTTRMSNNADNSTTVAAVGTGIISLPNRIVLTDAKLLSPPPRHREKSNLDLVILLELII